jgi:hypothetical protein
MYLDQGFHYCYSSGSQIFCWHRGVSDCCLTPTHKFLAIAWQEQVNFQLNDEEVRFDLDQHA